MDVYPIRPVTPDEAAGFTAVFAQAFNSTWPADAALRYQLGTFEPDRSLAAFDGDQIVGTACSFTFQMAVPGAMTGVAGVSWVGVLPSHRRRGILSSLMRRQLSDITGRGEAVAALFSSESSIYRRYGYGVASEDLNFVIKHGEGGLLPLRPPGPADPAGPDVRLTLATPAEAKTELGKIYGTVLAARPGMISRDDRWWDHELADPEFMRGSFGPLRCLIARDDAGPRGYALYTAKPAWGNDGIPAGELQIKELFAADPAAYAAIWTDLLTRDLVSEVRAWLRPVDDPLLQLLVDRRRARAQLGDGLWVRLADVPAALAARRYACAVDVVLDVTDHLMAGNSGRWRLQAGGPSDPASPACERTRAAAEISLPVSALGALYLGSSRLGALAGAGQVTELKPGAIAALSTAMSWDPAPWCPAIF